MSIPGHNEVSSPGGQVGGRIAKLLADATIYTRQRMGPHQNQLVQKALADFTNHVSDEVRGILGPLWKQIADEEATPEELRPFFQALATERGQAFAWLGGTVGSAAVSAGLMAILNNLLAPVSHAFLSADPNMQLSPEVAAGLVARAIWDEDTGQREALKSGVAKSRFDALRRGSANYPAVSEVIELVRRREIQESDGARMMRKLGFYPEDIQDLLKLVRVPLTVEQLAAMVNRDILTPDHARTLAQKLGVSREDIDRLTLLGGDPLSPQDLGAAYRRGIINRERFEHGIIQGPLRKEWFDVLEKLQISRMSTVDAADAVNQGYMQLGEAQRIARENGLDPEDFATLIQMAGQPPGVEFAQEAWNRGFISEQEFETMFLESRIKNRYMPLLKAMRVRIIPQETVRLLYREGVYSRDATLQTLIKHGFTAEDAAALLALEDSRGDETTRELTRAQIIDLYEEGILQLNDTVEMLLGLRYSEASARAMIELANLRNVRKFINSAITRVRSAYLTGKIDLGEASAQLDALTVQSGQRDQYLAVWEVDRDTVSKTLTPAQIRQAHKKEFITEDDAIERLVVSGYSRDDAVLFLKLTA